jgi:glycosyltransferase involved in cell wall biosynthesis
LDVLALYKKKTKCKIIHYAHDFHLVCPNRGYFYLRQGKIINFQAPPAIAAFLTKRLEYRGRFYSLLKKIQWIWAYPIKKKQAVFDLVLAPSDFLTDHIRQACPDLVVQRMYNCCDALTVHIAKANTEKSNTLRMVYFGRIAKEKGLAAFITALRSSSVNYTFTVIGEGDEKPCLQALISANKLQDRVFIRPKLDAAILFSELSNFDVYVLPSLWYENAPLSIVEAASLGLGLFLVRHGGAMEIGCICGATHFFDPSDPADIVDNMEAVYRDFVNDALPKANSALLYSLFSEETYVQNLKKYLDE